MKKRLLLLTIITFICCTLNVEAKNKYIEKQFGIRDGYTYSDAINWSNVNETEDGYIVTTLSSSGYGVMRKIDKNDGSIIWENYDESGAFFGDAHIYNGHIFVLCYDFYYGTYLIEYDNDGNYIDDIEINNITYNPYVYGGETYLKGHNLYYIYKAYDSSAESDTVYAPVVIANIDLDKYEVVSVKPYESYSDTNIEYITDGQKELIDENLNHIYQENGYETHIYQQMIRDGYKYYIGELYNDYETHGVVIKADNNNNVIWAKKSEEDNMVYYDCVYLGNDIIAVSGYAGATYDYPENMYSEIRVFDSNGNIVENHDINSELGIQNGDVISFKKMSDGYVAQVITWNESSYQSYVLKYSAVPYEIVKEVEGNGYIEAIATAMPGNEVTYRIVPEEGYTIKKVTITDEYGNTVTTTSNTFVMPNGKVTIKAEFTKINNPNTGIINILKLGLFILGISSILYIISKRKNAIKK